MEKALVKGPGNSSDDIEAVVIESAATASVVIEATIVSKQ